MLESLERAAALAPNDPLFAEAVRLVRNRADMAQADAMRRVFLLFDAGELVENSFGFDFMFLDVDRDGIVELLTEFYYNVHCNRYGLDGREAGLFRWDGTRMTRASLETLPTGAVSEAVAAANNRAWSSPAPAGGRRPSPFSIALALS